MAAATANSIIRGGEGEAQTMLQGEKLARDDGRHDSIDCQPNGLLQDHRHA